MILGFDPRYQFVHEDDVVHALEHVVQRRLPGVFNVAADGVLALSEVAGLLGKPYAPVLPPWGTGPGGGAGPPARACRSRPRCSTSCASAAAWTTAGSRRAGFEYGYTSREAVIAARRAPAAASAAARRAAEPYRYEREVEEFLRWSPNVRNSRCGTAAASAARRCSNSSGCWPAYSGPGTAASRPERPSRPRRVRKRRSAAAAAPRPPSRPARRSTTTTTSRPRRSSPCWARSSRADLVALRELRARPPRAGDA